MIYLDQYKQINRHKTQQNHTWYWGTSEFEFDLADRFLVKKAEQEEEAPATMAADIFWLTIFCKERENKFECVYQQC